MPARTKVLPALRDIEGSNLTALISAHEAGRHPLISGYPGCLYCEYRKDRGHEPFPNREFVIAKQRDDKPQPRKNAERLARSHSSGSRGSEGYAT